MSASRKAPLPEGHADPRDQDFGLSRLAFVDPPDPPLPQQPQPQQQLEYYPAYPQHSRVFQQSYPAYPQYQQQFYDPHDVTTMHGMPGYPHRPPVTRSNQTSPLNPSPPYPQQPPNQQPFSRPPVKTQGSFWSPPMSPVMPPFGTHSRQPSYADEYGMHRGFGPPPSAWTSPSAPSQPYFYTPYQQQIPTMEAHHPPPAPPSDWSNASPYVQRGSWNGPPPPLHRQNNRMSWSGPSSRPEMTEKERERKAYHPQAPARRSDFVMWVGNVPNNTSHEELWRYFNTTVPLSLEGSDEPWLGPSSIFLISRSSCAFVNLSSQNDLDRAVAFFNGRALRPWDPRCPLMVCRVRRKDDDLRAGVGAQRGTGMHREWVKLQSPPAGEPLTSPLSPSVLEQEQLPEGEGRRRESVVDAIDDTRHKSSESYASTNSSFLAKHFPRRVFILKSLTTAELEESVETGMWRTQRHNEPILDQAFRTSQEVILIFGANRAGGFFGYAKMVEPIDKERAKLRSTPSSGSSKPTETKSDGYFLSPSLSHLAATSPSELTPAEEPSGTVVRALHQRMTDPPHAKSAPGGDKKSGGSAPAGRTARAQTLNPKDVQPNYFPPVPLQPPSGESSKDRESRQVQPDSDGVVRKDTVSPAGKKSLPRGKDARLPEGDAGLSDRDMGLAKESGDAMGALQGAMLSLGENNSRANKRPEDDLAGDGDGRGKPFKIEWIKVGSLPFTRTRHLRNPWNADREVKVSRDGTEVEPNVALQLMAEWDKLSNYPAI